ncbi:hypothetical protein GCM10009808_16990 [Microbacterium sediminicola]|uniref:ABC-2 type transporter transmembrane domain-containing protein n=1 Tax=Microbacterium sediminicola TaxID=415210 RepID=A0ABN2I7J8_9MICO
MSLPVERARTRKPITWLTVIGVILLPAIIGGILVLALYDPTERLDHITAAVVNNDDPVTIDGQTVPLGRQLTAGLVGEPDPSGDDTTNITWVISNDEDAAAGLADGTYAAIVTIPENFSAAATSTQPGGTPEQATIEVTTPPDSLIVDDAITAQITATAASLTGQELTTVYLENVLLAFTTLATELGTAADGADQLADGMQQSADGSTELADGMNQLADGASELSSAAYTIADGTSQLAAGQAAWAAGAGEAAAGLNDWAGGATALAGGSQQLTDGLYTLADQTSQIPTLSQDVVDAAYALAANSAQISDDVNTAVADLNALLADCISGGWPSDICDMIQEITDDANAALPTVNEILDNSDAIAQGVDELSTLGPDLTAGVTQLADGSNQITQGLYGLSNGAVDAANGVAALASGASTIATETGTLASGVSQWAAGTTQWADGASEAAAGTTALAEGNAQLAEGTAELADGLHTAADSLPTYTDEEAENLAEVVADPVAAEGIGTSLFGASAIPLLATLALWFGALASFVALRAVPQRALASRAPSALLALRSLWPAAAIGAVQGLLVAIIVQIAAGYDFGAWTVFAGVAVVAGVAFAAINQALVAVLGGAGRWVGALVGVLAVATGIVSTVPGFLSSLASIMPTTPAYNAMLAALTSSSGVGAGLAGVVIWGALAFAATVLAVARARTISAHDLAEAPAT